MAEEKHIPPESLSSTTHENAEVPSPARDEAWKTLADLASEAGKLLAEIRTAGPRGPSERDTWDKAIIIAKFLTPLMIPAVVAVIGYFVTAYAQVRQTQAEEAIQERQIQTRLVEVAIDVLRTEPSEKGVGIREWAKGVVNEYSGVPLPTEVLTVPIPWSVETQTIPTEAPPQSGIIRVPGEVESQTTPTEAPPQSGIIRGDAKSQTTPNEAGKQ